MPAMRPQAGRALRACHDALAGIDVPAWTSSRWPCWPRRGAWRRPRSREALPAIDRARATLGAAPHGSSTATAIPATSCGLPAPLWSDWEDAHLAPLEWDLACLVTAGRVHGNDFGWGEAALDAHGGPFDAALLEACVDARVAQGAAYLAATGRGDREALHRRLEWPARGA